MKKFVYILSLLVFSCSSGGSGEDDISTPVPKEQNVAPTVPSLVSPVNKLLCIDNVLEFKWNASSDSNGDSITYKVEVSTSDRFSTIEFTATVSGTSKEFNLKKGVAYYWRVKAIDSKNASSVYSQVYSLYTEGEGESNHLPFAPVLVSPTLNSSINVGEITLSWSASDTDGDDLTFDVYVDTVNPPVSLVSENQTEILHKMTTESSKEYFWKIVVKDDKQGNTVGQIWSFKTN